MVEQIVTVGLFGKLLTDIAVRIYENITVFVAGFFESAAVLLVESGLCRK